MHILINNIYRAMKNQDIIPLRRGDRFYKTFPELTAEDLLKAEADKKRIGMTDGKFKRCKFIFQNDKYQGILDYEPFLNE